MKACMFSFSITIYNAFVSVDSNSSISLTAHNQTHIHTKFFFFFCIYCPTIPSQNTDLSSWITLYADAEIMVIDEGQSKFAFGISTSTHSGTNTLPFYSPCLYRASICAWRMFSPGTTMAGSVRDLRRGAGLPPTGFTSGATPAQPLLQEKMM